MNYIMIKFDNIEVLNFPNAIHGMRHPLCSYNKSDSTYKENNEFVLGDNDKAYWYELIQLLPSSFNQTRMCTLNYETLINQWHSRKSHKLDEWKIYCKDFIANLPYANELIIID